MLRHLLMLIVVAAVTTDVQGADAPAPVEKLILDLKDGDESARIDAVCRLRDLGIAARSAKGQLLAALDDEEPTVRASAAEALLCVGGDPALVKPLLRDAECSVRLAVVEALLSHEGDIASVTPVLVELRSTATEDILARFKAEEIIKALSPKLSRRMQSLLVDSLPKADEEMCDVVMECLADLAPIDPSLVPRLTAFLKLEHEELRIKSAGLLMEIGPEARMAVPPLRALAKGPDPALALAAAAAVAAISDEHDDCMLQLSDALQENDPAARSQAATLVSGLGTRAVGAIPGLIVALTDGSGLLSDDNCRRNCSTILKKLGKPAVAPLVEALDRNPYFAPRCAVLSTLRDIGSEAEPAVPALVALLAGDDLGPELRIDVMRTLAAIGPAAKSAIPALLAELDSADVAARIAAAESLGKLGPLERAARQRLKQGLTDEIPLVRLSSAAALAAQENEPQAIDPTLLELIDESDPELCQCALQALRALGPRAAPAVPKLVASLSFTKGIPMGFGGIHLNHSVQSALVAVGAPAVPALIPALKHSDATVRALAAEALRQIGPDARAAVGQLAEVLDDDANVMVIIGCMGYNQTVGERAILALKAVGPEAKAALPRLCEILKRDAERPHAPDMRQERLESIAAVLAAIGPQARTTVPQIEELLRRDNSRLDDAAHAALVVAMARIAPESTAVVPGLRWLFGEVRSGRSANVSLGDAAEAIVAIGPRGQTLLPDLLEIVEDCPLLHCRVRCDAAFAVAQIDPENARALRFLKWAGRSHDPTIQRDAREKLERLRSSARVDAE